MGGKDIKNQILGVRSVYAHNVTFFLCNVSAK